MTLSSQVIEILDALCTKFGIIVDWTQDSILPYVQSLAEKYISWEIATSTAWIIAAVLLCVLGVALMILDTKICDGFVSLLGIGVILIALFIAGCQISDILTCKYFPERQIFLYFNHLIQTYRG